MWNRGNLKFKLGIPVSHYVFATTLYYISEKENNLIDSIMKLQGLPLF
jgi:hypothetical protein